MDKTKFLKMCQKVSVLPDGEMHIKTSVPDELKVIYKGSLYYPIERVAGFDRNGMLVLKARLHSLYDNSVTECLLKNVEEFVK